MSEDFDEYIVRFKYCSEYRNVYIKKDALTLNKLLDYAFDAFQIGLKGDVIVNLTDNMDIPIPKEKIVSHVKAFWRNESFFINLSYKGDPNMRSVDVVTPMMIQDYFMEINEGVFLNECKYKNQKEVNARHKVVQLAVDFMMNMYGDDVTIFQREMVANALIKLFPFVGYQGENNIGTRTLLSGSKGGWLNVRYYSVRALQRKQQEKEAETPEVNPTIENYDAQPDIDLLKTLIISSENIAIVKEKLNATRSFRSEMMMKDETEIKEHFPYFFTHPMILIPLEFEEKYKDKGVEPNALIDNWTHYCQQLHHILNVEHKKTPHATEFADDIANFLIFLQMFPSKQIGRNVIATYPNFNKSVEKLLQFELVYSAPDEMASKARSYPVIIPCGETAKEIMCYFIKVENQIIPLPEDVGFVHAFDIFYKIHKIWDLKFEPSLQSMMTFIENYIYKINGENKPTNRMLEISGKMHRGMIGPHNVQV